MMLRSRVFALHKKAGDLAFSWYIRKGHIPFLLEEIVAATVSLDAFVKYNPDQPRVPAGSGRESGEWTSGGDGDDDIKPTDAIEPVYPVENLLLALIPAGRLLNVWRTFVEGGGVLAEEGAAAETDWMLGNFKSAQRWANQLEDRDWTLDQITDTIADGEQFPAPNEVNPANTATRYQDTETDRFVVRDDVTKEILQVSGRGFIPKEIPGK